MTGHRIEYPDLSTRMLMPPEHPAPGADAYTTEATRLEASEAGVTIDAQPVPWYLARVPMQVDVEPDGSFVVYLPVRVRDAVVAGPGVRDVRLGELLADEPPAYDEPG